MNAYPQQTSVGHDAVGPGGSIRIARRHPLRSRHRRRPSRDGAYVVEFAICASVFFMVIFACFELARYMYIQQAVDQTAYEAARQGVIVGADAEDVTGRAEELLQAYGVLFADVDVTPATIDESTGEITVRIQCSFADNSWITPKFVSGSDIITTVTLDHENQAYLISDEATEDDDLQNNDEPLDT